MKWGLYVLCAFTAIGSALVMTAGGSMLLEWRESLPPWVLWLAIWGWVSVCFGVTWWFGFENGRRARGC
jgi:uncharacterized membrane protein YkvI